MGTKVTIIRALTPNEVETRYPAAVDTLASILVDTGDSAEAVDALHEYAAGHTFSLAWRDQRSRRHRARGLHTGGHHPDHHRVGSRVSDTRFDVPTPPHWVRNRPTPGTRNCHAWPAYSACYFFGCSGLFSIPGRSSVHLHACQLHERSPSHTHVLFSISGDPPTDFRNQFQL